jgi:hypothetical protein
MVIRFREKAMSTLTLDDDGFVRFARGELSQRENLKFAWHLAHSEEARKRLAELVPNGEEILAGLGLHSTAGVKRKPAPRRRPKPRRYEEDKEPPNPLARFLRGELSHRENLKLAWRLLNSSALRRELAELPGGKEVLKDLLGGMRVDWGVETPSRGRVAALASDPPGSQPPASKTSDPPAREPRRKR